MVNIPVGTLVGGRSDTVYRGATQRSASIIPANSVFLPPYTLYPCPPLYVYLYSLTSVCRKDPEPR